MSRRSGTRYVTTVVHVRACIQSQVPFLSGGRGQVYHEMMLVTMEEYDKKERDAEASVKQRYKDVARYVITLAWHWTCRDHAMHYWCVKRG